MECLLPKPNGSKASRSDSADTDAASNTCAVYEVPSETDRQLRERLIASGFPTSLAGLTFDDLTVDDLNRDKIQKAKAFAENPIGGLYICGEFGTGKTWLSAAIGNAVARKTKRVLFGTFATITDKLIAAQKYGTFDTEREMYAHKADLLIVDDIGKEKPSEWKLQTLFKLIDERNGDNLPTVFTSNYSLAALCSRISPDNNDTITVGAIKDRLKRFVPLILGGESRR